MENRIINTLRDVLAVRGFGRDEITIVPASDGQPWLIFAMQADEAERPRRRVADTTLVIRTIDVSFCRSVAKSLQHLASSALARLEGVTTRDVKRVILVANKSKIRTKQLTFTMEDWRAPLTDDDEGSGSSRVHGRILAAESLLYNALRHKLVPSFEPLDEGRIQELVANYQLKSPHDTMTQADILAFVDCIGKIGCNDPIVALLGGLPAASSANGIPTIYEIRRPQGDIAYRAVVADFGL